MSEIYDGTRYELYVHWSKGWYPDPRYSRQDPQVFHPGEFTVALPHQCDEWLFNYPASADPDVTEQALVDLVTEATEALEAFRAWRQTPEAAEALRLMTEGEPR